MYGRCSGGVVRVLLDSVGLASAAQACWEGTYIRGGRASLFLSQRAVRIDVTTVPAPTNKSDSPVADVFSGLPAQDSCGGV